MAKTYGLVGLRPTPEHVAGVVSLPYDVEKMGAALGRLMRENPKSLYHVILGQDPRTALTRMVSQGWLQPDEEPCYYVYEQNWQNQTRLGVLFSGEVTDYAERQVIRHEKTFDEKVRDRIALKKAIGHHIGPVFLVTQAPLRAILQNCTLHAPLFAFSSEVEEGGDPEGMWNRVWRVQEGSVSGNALQRALGEHPLYIADGHHRYHAALKGGLQRYVGYATEEAQILAYNRVVSGTRKFAHVLDSLPVKRTARFSTPPQHTYALYSGGVSYLLPSSASATSDDVVSRLDCTALERDLYIHLGLTPSLLQNAQHFGYYPEWALAEMKRQVDQGRYDLAVALHPVSIQELIAVANAGLDDPRIVMPEKSTFFFPKVLSGLFLQRNL